MDLTSTISILDFASDAGLRGLGKAEFVDRLDFTIVGPAVNETSRIAALCRSVEKDILMSSAFAAASPPEECVRYVSVGRYALRGVERAQELFTLERG